MFDEILQGRKPAVSPTNAALINPLLSDTRPLSPHPKPIRIGDTVLLVPVVVANRYFPGHNARGIVWILDALCVPIVTMRDGQYFNLYSLEKVLHYLTMPGGRGVVFPGTYLKKQKNYARIHRKEPTYRMDVFDVEQLENPVIVGDRLTTGTPSKANAAAYLKILMGQIKRRYTQGADTKKAKKRPMIPEAPVVIPPIEDDKLIEMDNSAENMKDVEQMLKDIANEPITPADNADSRE